MCYNRFLYDNFSENGPCLGSRSQSGGPYKYMSYSEVIDTAKDVGAGFISKGQLPGNFTRIGIYSRNMKEVRLPIV